MRHPFAVAAVLAAANAIAFLLLGLHTRVPLWIFSFGFTDLAVGTGFFATSMWVPRLVTENDRDARILTYVLWILIGVVMWMPSLL